MTSKPYCIILTAILCACTPPPDCPPAPEQECECPEGTPPPPEPALTGIDETPVEVQADGRIVLPAPRKNRGLPLMKALSLRRSMRQYSDRKLGLQTLSDLL